MRNYSKMCKLYEKLSRVEIATNAANLNAHTRKSNSTAFSKEFRTYQKSNAHTTVFAEYCKNSTLVVFQFLHSSCRTLQEL